MLYPALLTGALVLLIAFFIDHLARRLRQPAVVLLLATGLMGQPLLNALDLAPSGLDTAVPVLGTIGLVLIVLEGAFDLSLARDRWPTALWATASATLGFGVWLTVLAGLAHLTLGLSTHHSVVVAIPMAVISSAVAIPSSRHLPPASQEFVIYESSISDILGILLFYALLSSDGTLSGLMGHLATSGGLSLVLGLVCALGLLALMMRLDGHVRFVPMLAGLFALYAAGKLMHLSPLILVLIFGLVLNNPALLKPFPGLNRLPESPDYADTIHAFKSITCELTFAVRGFFFIMLGYWTDLSALASYQAWLAALLILVVIYGVRQGLLALLRPPHWRALTWLAPRGLITVLLFLQAQEVVPLPDYLNGTVMLVVLASALAIGQSRQALAS